MCFIEHNLVTVAAVVSILRIPGLR